MAQHRIHPGVGARRRTGRKAAVVAGGAAVLCCAAALLRFEQPGPAEGAASRRAEADGSSVPRRLLEQQSLHAQGQQPPPRDAPPAAAGRPRPAAAVPPHLARVLAPHRLLEGDEILAAAGPTPGDLADLEGSRIGAPTLDPEALREQLVTEGFGMIPGVMDPSVAARVRKYLLGLLSVPGVVWKPNEGDNTTDGTLGRVMMGLPPQWYRSLDPILQNPEMHRYLQRLMPCRGVPGLSSRYRMTQLFITVNDRIRWHVDYPEQPPYKRKKTQMYSPQFCQYKVIFYLQDHTKETDSDPSALSVVPRTHSRAPEFEDCPGCPSSGALCCRAARKGKAPASHYRSVQTRPGLGDLLVMDARSLHAASHPSLNLPLQPLPEKPPPRRHKYRVFLQFLWGVTDNVLTDMMQKKKDRNLVVKHFSKLVYP